MTAAIVLLFFYKSSENTVFTWPRSTCGVAFGAGAGPTAVDFLASDDGVIMNIVIRNIIELIK